MQSADVRPHYVTVLNIIIMKLMIIIMMMTMVTMTMMIMIVHLSSSQAESEAIVVLFKFYSDHLSQVYSDINDINVLMIGEDENNDKSNS